ncbi:MAG TPA: TonB-dependent receptor [Bryobacteraceae bacterium]|nr:TonB-dependent receptor [Bryobacteraceae bacterium]
MRTLRTVAWSALLLLYPAMHVLSQVNATGTFSGQVLDPSGAPVSNAEVKVTQQETGISVSKQTASDGNYTVPLLKPGTYTIAVTAPGFKSEIRKDIVLQVQQVAQQDFSLQIGDVQQQVTVEGAPPLLNTESTEIGNVLSQQSTQQLPLNGRNFSQLGLLVPGTNPGPVGGIRTQGNGNETQRAGAEIVADGSRGSFNTFMIDGLNDEDQSVGTLKVFPNLESIEEFKVQVGNYDAQFVSGGAVVNVITRSGGNQIHGSAFEFLRNFDLDSRQFFDAQKPPFQQNQFGAAIGGPIRRNKTFFFGDYQGLRVHESSTSIVTEPTTAMRSGNFNGVATIYNAATYNSTTNTRTQFAGNIIPTTAMDPIALNLLAIIPLPNIPGNKTNLRLNDLAVQTQDQYDVRVDQVFSDRDSMFGRVTHGGADITYPATPVFINGEPNPLAFVQGAATAGSLRLNHAPSNQATLQEVHQFSPSVTNQVALGYTRFALQVTPLDEPDNVAQKLGLQGANTGADSGAMASLSISGYAGYSSANLPEIIPQNTWQANDTVTYIRGAHSFRFGFDVIHNGFGFFQLGAPSGSLSFSGVYTNNPATSSGGNGFADFLLGLPVSSSKSAAPYGVPYESYTEYGAFVQDQWRVSSHLTVNLGLRYDLFTPVKERHDRQSDFFLGSGSTLAIAGQNGISDTILNIQNHNFSPRLGLAYRLGDKTVVRAAYGLFYFDEQGVGGSTRLFINNPFAAQYAVNCSSTAPCLHTSTGIPTTASVSNLPTVVYQPTSNLTPNMQQWNLTLERQLASSFIVRGAYVGSRGNHLNINMQEDVAFPGPGSVTAREPYPTVASISAWEPRGPSSYNGLQLSAEKRFSAGLSFLGAYTYSKSLDEGAGGNSSTGESRINIQNPRNVAADYGLSNFDYKQRFTLSAIYDLPFGHGRKFLGNANAIENVVAGGWQVTSIVTLQSGAPFSVSLATPTANTGTFTRPNRICDGNLPTSQQSISEWYNISCFVAPPIYTFGNAGRNILIGPGLATWDLGGDKDFRLTERFGLQFRSEFFNVLNHANFGLPNGSIGSTAAGTVTTVITNARQIQFALRLHW